MKEIYEVSQGKTVNGKWEQPVFPMNKENLEKMLETTVAIRLEKPRKARWGSGIYELDTETGEYKCISSDWDSSD